MRCSAPSFRTCRQNDTNSTTNSPAKTTEQNHTVNTAKMPRGAYFLGCPFFGHRELREIFPTSLSSAITETA